MSGSTEFVHFKWTGQTLPEALLGIRFVSTEILLGANHRRCICRLHWFAQERLGDAGFCDHLLNCAFQVVETVTARGYPLTSTSNSPGPPHPRMGIGGTRDNGHPAALRAGGKPFPRRSRALLGGPSPQTLLGALAVSVHSDSRTAPSLLPPQRLESPSRRSH